jgi:hypothetical protein
MSTLEDVRLKKGLAKYECVAIPGKWLQPPVNLFLSIIYTNILVLLYQAHDYTIQLERVSLMAQNRQTFPDELNKGLQVQRMQLEKLVDRFRKQDMDFDDPTKLNAWLFRKVCDVWSLYPENNSFPSLIEKIVYKLNGIAAFKLQTDMEKHFCLVHISCGSKIAEAKESLRSFSSLGEDVRQIIVIADQAVDEGRFYLKYDGLIMTLNCPDNYESHFKKCFHCFALLAITANPKLIFKVDDDIRLSDSWKSRSTLSKLANLNIMYAGVPISGRNNYRKFWHGWHIGKCSEKNYETMGYQAPIPSQYADGGSGYWPGQVSLQELAFLYFIQQAFLNVQSVLFEDAMVGLFLQQTGIELTGICLDGCLASYGVLMQEGFGEKYTQFITKKKANLEMRNDHLILYEQDQERFIKNKQANYC